MADAGVDILGAAGRVSRMCQTGARLVARLHVDFGHVSSAVCMRG